MLLPEFKKCVETLRFRRRWIASIVAIQVMAVVFEAIGMASIVPVLEFMRTPQDAGKLATTSDGWAWFVQLADRVGFPIGLESVLAVAFLAIVVRQIFVYWRLVLSARIQNELLVGLRQRGLDLYLSARTDAQGLHGGGSTINDLTMEAQASVDCMRSALNVISFSLVLAGYMAIALLLSPTLSMVAAGITAVIGAVMMLVTRSVRATGKSVTAANQASTAFLGERLGAARLVKLCGMQKAESAAFSKFLAEQARHLFQMQKTLAVLTVLLEPVVLLFGFVMLGYAVRQQLVGFEGLILFFFILLRLVPIAKELLFNRQWYVAKLASVNALERRFADLAANREQDRGTRLLSAVRDGIKFDRVTFAYAGAGGGHALKNINLFLPAGQTVALVGPSGAGKSTLIDLIPRIRTPQSGNVTIDGVPVEDYRLNSLRGAVSFAPQTPQLFNVTIREHILYGKPEASDAEVRQAARLAQILDVIDGLPEGFDTRIGSNGDRLSGGQRQRLDLARALVRKAPVLILDEPTANLDAESAHLFHVALSRIRSETDTTIIIIGHYLPSVRNADLIVVLNEGGVESTGRHEELVAGGGWYARAYATQTPDSKSGERAASAGRPR